MLKRLTLILFLIGISFFCSISAQTQIAGEQVSTSPANLHFDEQELIDSFSLKCTPPILIFENFPLTILEQHFSSQEETISTKDEKTNEKMLGFALGEERKTSERNNLATTIIIVILLIVITIIQNKNPEILRTILLSAVLFKNAEVIYFNKRKAFSPLIFLLNILFSIILAIFVYQILATQTEISLPIYLVLPIVAAAFIIIFLLYTFAWNFLALIFRFREFSKQYIFNLKLLNAAASIISIPLIFISAFIKIEFSLYFIFFIISILALFYIAHIIRFIQINLQFSNHTFQFFPYLCAAEFLPILILLKTIDIISVTF